MSAGIATADYFEGHPLDLMEQVATLQEWGFERSHEDEMNLCVSGTWHDYQISLNWRPDLAGLHVACTLDIKVPETRRTEIRHLIAIINEHLWAGHFDLWSDDGMLLYRNSLLLCGGASATPEQCEILLRLGIEACERYFPAIQFVIWAGKTAEEAFQAALFETQGNA
ncbi:MAG: YbjN domain-containing protein [Parvibaculaceae bacterium]|nr:YbjN domain-containing protein [Parvibaculaceae bacterium]